MTRWPAEIRTGTWYSHERPLRGHPWMRTTGFPLRCASTKSSAGMLFSVPTASLAMIHVSSCELRELLVSLPLLLGCKGTDVLGRGHEVVGAGKWLDVPGERVAHTVKHPRHALEHLRHAPLLGAEADEHRAVVGDRSVRHVAAEDLAEAVLVGAGRMGVHP